MPPQPAFLWMASLTLQTTRTASASDFLSNVNRNSTIENTRRHIGKGNTNARTQKEMQIG